MRWCFLLSLLLLASGSAWCRSLNEVIPEGYRQVAMEYAIPPALLYSMALAESEDGYKGKALPWPWTINHKGKGYFFDSRQAAYDFASGLVKQGEESFDIGLMQTNWYWHKHRYTDLWEAFDPYTNLRTAAQIVAEYRDKRGSFEDAVGAYHAPNDPEKAAAYRERVRYKLKLIMGGHR